MDLTSFNQTGQNLTKAILMLRAYCVEKKMRIWNIFCSDVNYFETTRQVTIHAIDKEVNKIINRRMHQMSNEEKIQIILDCSFLLNNDITMKLGYRKLSENKLTDLEFQCRRHLYNMHSARYRMMTLIRSRKQ